MKRHAHHALLIFAAIVAIGYIFRSQLAAWLSAVGGSVDNVLSPAAISPAPAPVPSPGVVQVAGALPATTAGGNVSSSPASPPVLAPVPVFSPAITQAAEQTAGASIAKNLQIGVQLDKLSGSYTGFGVPLSGSGFEPVFPDEFWGGVDVSSGPGFIPGALAG